MGDPPQPNPLAKSLPVPMGMMVKSTWLVLILSLAISSTTHTTVPSPPQTTVLIYLSYPF